MELHPYRPIDGLGSCVVQLMSHSIRSCSPSSRRTNAEPSIADYDERRGPLVAYWKSQNGPQSGDPAKLARALITISEQVPPPQRFVAGADAVAGAEQKVALLQQQINANRELSRSLSFDAGATN